MKTIIKRVAWSLGNNSRWHTVMLLVGFMLLGLSAATMSIRTALFWLNVKLPVEAAFRPEASPRETADSLRNAAAWLRPLLGPEASSEERLWLNRFEAGAVAITAATDATSVRLATLDAMLSLCDYQEGMARLRKVSDAVVMRPLSTPLHVVFYLSVAMVVFAASRLLGQVSMALRLGSDDAG